jgi:hypothetical protein
MADKVQNADLEAAVTPHDSGNRDPPFLAFPRQDLLRADHR